VCRLNGFPLLKLLVPDSNAVIFFFDKAMQLSLVVLKQMLSSVAALKLISFICM
jgi:hypothetical protein